MVCAYAYFFCGIIFYPKKRRIKISVVIFSVRDGNPPFLHKSILGFRFWTFFLSNFQKGIYFCAKTRAENHL
jgi:hypothetical protein